MIRMFRSLAVAALVAALAPAPAARAHPHSWIDLSVAVRFDDAGRISGLSQTWLFDEVYTAYIIDSFVKERGFPKSGAGLKPIAERIMGNLRDYSYFTHATADGAAAEIAEVRDADATMRGRRFELRFTVAFRTPAPATAFTYAVYDPTYYIEMLHAEGGEPVRLEGAPPGCAVRFAKPTPSLEAITLAASLDQTQTASDTLGELFAEKVTVACP